MRYLQQHISTLAGSYDGRLPLAYYLRRYFKQHPVLGSRDRKVIAEMLYCYYRCSRGLPGQLSLSDKINYSLLLTESSLDAVRKLLPEPVQPIYGTGRDNALRFLRQQGITFDPSLLLSGTPGFSAGITREHWVDSLLQKPDLFIRLTKKYAASALKKLHEAGIHVEPVENLDHYSWRLPNGTPVEKILAEKEYRVQDASSQLTGRFLPVENGFQCWDCCSGAGGKSLLIMDRQPGVQLCVSDIRKSILENLADRFRLYGHRVPERVVVSVADREQVARMMNGRMFDLVVADVPCSGSGTWARTPEQLYFFNPDVIKTFSHTQKQIASNAIEHVKPGGYFTYITCSVFAEENEVVVTQLLEENGDFYLSEQLLINGVSGKADSMFIAVLQRKIKDQ